ncbi:MAG: class IV adenylate cyclase [Deltaproteobacteria bacterium]|nr:MAG: class IV adenylate cyclase [Deltaproteobacteria bacterium]
MLIMMEIEIKARVKNRDEVKERIKSIGNFVRKEHQEDLYFDSPYRNFVESGEVLRIRKTLHKNTLTYKKKRTDERARIRIEHEAKVESGDDIAEILEDLGFIQIAKIRKEREIYNTNECKIELDMVEGLGEFVEVEILIPEDEDITKSKEKIFGILEKIGVPRENIEKKPYLELYLDKKRWIGEKKR